jgi:metal-responsive CopG/Arc/MetJ family transcriptional regulator
MVKPRTVIRKKRSRPATGQDPKVALRMPSDLMERIDRWVERNGKDSRSEAMRHLLELGLSTSKRRKGTTK